MFNRPNNPLICVLFGWLLTFALPAPGASSRNTEPATVEANLHGLAVTLDADSGSLLRLRYAGVGTMLDSRPDRATILDLAIPIKEFEPLRLASRYSQGAQIQVTADGVIIHWERLGKSRGDWAVIGGDVSATGSQSRRRWPVYNHAVRGREPVQRHLFGRLCFPISADAAVCWDEQYDVPRVDLRHAAV